MYHNELGKTTFEIERDEQADTDARNVKLSEVATLLTALVEQKATGPYSGKSLDWWRKALINAQLANLWFEEGDTEGLFDKVYEMTGVQAPGDWDAYHDVYRIAYEIAYYEDE